MIMPSALRVAPSPPSVSCSNCEACCCRLLVVLMPDDVVPSRYVVRDERDLEVMDRLDDGYCVALDRDTMRCSIYATRPFICREYEMGADDCLLQRRKHRLIESVCV
jgi:Fe-S-cluster containining protein